MPTGSSWKPEPDTSCPTATATFRSARLINGKSMSSTERWAAPDSRHGIGTLHARQEMLSRSLTRSLRATGVGCVPTSSSSTSTARVCRSRLSTPHGHHLADALPKLRGLADFAATHGESFHRIESVARIRGRHTACARAHRAIRPKGHPRSRRHQGPLPRGLCHRLLVDCLRIIFPMLDASRRGIRLAGDSSTNTG